MTKNKPSLYDYNFDDVIIPAIEELFPVKLTIDRTLDEAYFYFDERFPQMVGTKIKYKGAYFNEEDQQLSIAYDFVVNPHDINPADRSVQMLLFRVISTIFQMECELINQKKRSVNK